MKAFDSQPVKLVVVFRNAGFTANLVLISGVVLVLEVEFLTLTGHSSIVCYTQLDECPDPFGKFCMLFFVVY